MRAHVMTFDFRSLISQSSFVSMVRHIAPRNLVLLRRPPPSGPAPLLDTVRAALKGGHSRIHTPAAGEVVTMASVAAYAATLTQQLSQLVEDQPKARLPRATHAAGHASPSARQPLLCDFLRSRAPHASAACIGLCRTRLPACPCSHCSSLRVRPEAPRCFDAISAAHCHLLCSACALRVHWGAVAAGCVEQAAQHAKVAGVRAGSARSLPPRVAGLHREGARSAHRLPGAGRPPPELEDSHSRAAVLLGNMMVSDITQRLRERKLPVRSPAEAAGAVCGAAARCAMHVLLLRRWRHRASSALLPRRTRCVCVGPAACMPPMHAREGRARCAGSAAVPPTSTSHAWEACMQCSGGRVQVEQEGEVAKVGDGEEGMVVVHQLDTESRNALVVEGGLSQLYFQVRDEVYQHCRLVPN